MPEPLNVLDDEFLANVADSKRAAVPTVSSPGPGQKSLYQPRLGSTQRRHSYWYDSIIDWMLGNPRASQRECAKAMGKSEPTIRMIVQSDMFKARYEARRKEINENMAVEIAEETSGVALEALREVRKRLTNNPAAIPIGQLTEIAHSTLDRLGYGAKPLVPAQNTQVNVTVTVPANALAEAQAAMRNLHQKNALSEPTAPPIDITPSNSDVD